MKPISRVQYPINYRHSEMQQIIQDSINTTGYYPVFGYPEFLVYDNRLLEYGFTEYAISEVKKILGIELFGDSSMLVFMETTAKNCPSKMDYNGILSSRALLITKIEGRGNDPYAILDMLINTFNTYHELNQLGKLDQMYDYMEKWRVEYWPLLGKSIYLDNSPFATKLQPHFSQFFKRSF